MDAFDPLAVILVSSGSRGDRLLFRYPNDSDDGQEITLQAAPVKSPYAVRVAEDYQRGKPEHISNVCDRALTGYSDKVLRHVLAAKLELCNQRFEVKINDVLFVGYPMTLQQRQAATTSFNIVFGLRASSDESTIGAYQDLTKQIAIALRHEEKRCEYVSDQKKLMLAIQDDVAAMTEDSIESPFRTILQRSALAAQLKCIYDDLCQDGVVCVYINRWLRINFCLPHKLHLCTPSGANPERSLSKCEETGDVKRCIARLRPYHALLLLLDENELLMNLPLDSSPTLTRLVRVASPLKSLQKLASDADLSLGQTFQLVSHLVYWSKAIIIYPLCASNVYTLAPGTDTHVHSWLVQKFAKAFPGTSLPTALCEFSLPTRLSERKDVLHLPQQQAQQVQMVVWMLQHRLLVQLHLYVFLLPAPKGRTSSQSSSDTFTRHDRVDSVFSSSLEEYNGLGKFPSYTDLHSTLSEGSPDQGTFSTFSTKSPSVDITGSNNLVSDDMRKQWHMQETLMSTLTPGQRQMVRACPAAKDQEDLKLFVRLCPYFNGKHHLEEIMYYENVRRSQLHMLLDKFRDVLITCQHEDPATACLTSHHS